MRDLLTPAAGNAKTRKEGRAKVEGAILHLSPHALSGRNVCPWASKGCIASCLNTAGRGQVKGALDADNVSRYSIHRARLERTQLFFEDREAFLRKLDREIRALTRRAVKRFAQPAVRLNGTSDLPWESFKLDGMTLMERHPSVRFYDYTKSVRRMRLFLLGMLPFNYHLTFSRSEDNGDDAERLRQCGGTVAVVYDEPPTGDGFIDGTEDDWRWLDAPGSIVALEAKGRAKKDTTGFVVRRKETSK